MLFLELLIGILVVKMMPNVEVRDKTKMVINTLFWLSQVEEGSRKAPRQREASRKRAQKFQEETSFKTCPIILSWTKEDEDGVWPVVHEAILTFPERLCQFRASI